MHVSVLSTRASKHQDVHAKAVHLLQRGVPSHVCHVPQNHASTNLDRDKISAIRFLSALHFFCPAQGTECGDVKIPEMQYILGVLYKR